MLPLNAIEKKMKAVCTDYMKGEGKMKDDLIDKIKEDIKDWRKVSESNKTPKLPGEGFENGWKLGINRVCNTIERIIKDNQMSKRYLLIQAKGKSRRVINTSDNAEALENGAQNFNEQNNGYNYYVIDKLNPPIKELK